MKKAPSRFNAYELIEKDWPSRTKVDGYAGWVPARPVGYFSLIERIKCAWFVFTGKADVLFWPKQ